MSAVRGVDTFVLAELSKSKSAAAVKGGHGDRIHIQELPDSPLLVLLQRPRCTSRPLIGFGDWLVDRHSAKQLMRPKMLMDTLVSRPGVRKEN